MDPLAKVLLVSLTLAAGVGASVIVMVLRRRDQREGVQLSVELTPQGGWSLLNLTVKNCGALTIWVERVAFVLTKLDAEMQGGPAIGQGTLDIREFVAPRETLRFSLIEAVYNAAGKPQGVYDFELAGIALCREGAKWVECEASSYTVCMVRLSATRLRPARASQASLQSLEISARLRAALGAGANNDVRSTASTDADTSASVDNPQSVQ